MSQPMKILLHHPRDLPGDKAIVLEARLTHEFSNYRRVSKGSGRCMSPSVSAKDRLANERAFSITRGHTRPEVNGVRRSQQIDGLV